MSGISQATKTFQCYSYCLFFYKSCWSSLFKTNQGRGIDQPVTILNPYNLKIILWLILSIFILTCICTHKQQILNDNKGKAGVYMLKNNTNGKCYIGSSIDLSRRLQEYYSITYLERTTTNTNSAICSAQLRWTS